MTGSDHASQLLAGLTPEQREAVTHGEGPLLVLAAAGSGKTRVITRRIAWLLAQGVPPWQIVAITFTNKAAGEMARRVEQLVPGGRVWISTFHKFGVRLLRRYGERMGLDANFSVFDQEDRLKVVKNAIEAAEIKDGKLQASAAMHRISRAKNDLLTPAAFAQRAKSFFEQQVAHVYPAYEKLLRDARGMDFDDLLMIPALALKNDEELRAELDERFRYILIDEYQDTNKAQYAIVQALCKDHPNLFVVGDPDQSIYKFRGSDIRNILDFERDFTDARVIKLEKNFRSTQAILSAAGGLITHNRKRKGKRLLTDNPRGCPVRVFEVENQDVEAAVIARRIQEAVSRGERRYRDFAVFMRINALSRSLESSFMHHGVPYQMVKGFAFYERKEIRDILAYLRLIVNPSDDVAFLRVINEPARGIGRTSLQHLQEYARQREMPLLEAAAQARSVAALRGKAVGALEQFATTMRQLQRLADAPPAELIHEVITRTGYRDSLLKKSGEEELQRLANIEELQTAAAEFAEEDPEAGILGFLENVALASDVDGWQDQEDRVAVMTLHASKGLEFPVVFIMGFEQGLLPHERAVEQPDEVEEERRLAFVGMTRAKEELYLTYTRFRQFRGQSFWVVPSTFLREIPESEVEHESITAGAADRDPPPRRHRSHGQPEWTDAGAFLAAATRKPAGNDDGLEKGVLVKHAKYGVGRVLSVQGSGATRKVRVDFDNGPPRTFVAAMAKLQVVRSGRRK